MSKREAVPPHVKAILREKVLVPRDWLRFEKTDIGRALLMYGCLVRIYAPFGGGNPLARLKSHQRDLESDGYTNKPMPMRKEMEKVAMDEANHRPIDLVEIDNPINILATRRGCPHCGDEYELGDYDTYSQMWVEQRTRK